jgi:hypothetical protein
MFIQLLYIQAEVSHETYEYFNYTPHHHTPAVNIMTM